MIRRLRPVAAFLLGAGLLTACSGTPPREEAAPAPSADPTLAPALRLPEAVPARPEQALELVPASSDSVTLTDWDRLRARFGAEDLTSEAPVTDRFAFWEQAVSEAVLLTAGLLRDEDSTYLLDYGFTQDDVDWEVRFTGEEGPGYVLAFRPDQDMAEVRRAVADEVGPLAGATVLPERRLVVEGVADDGEDVWAHDAGWARLIDEDAETTYLHDGCLDATAALGPDASVEDVDAVAPLVEELDGLDGFAVGFAGDLATARTERDRSDLHRRADLTDAWPSTGGPSVADAFGTLPVADPGNGRIGLRIADPLSAAAVTLTGQLPFAVCDVITPIDEPTGL